MKDKPDCYKCEFQGEVAGSCHSSCHHSAAAQELNIKGHEIGVRKGWFMWPANFDPVWLINCDGFTAKDSTNG